VALAMVNAFFLVRIFIIQHDCGHQSFLKSKQLNNTIGFVCSFFTSIPYKYWAKLHNHHHGHSGQLEEEHRDIGDLPFYTVEEYQQLSNWNKFWYRVLRMPIIMFGFVPFYYLTFMNRVPLVKMKGWKNHRRTQLINNVLMIGLYVLLAYVLGWQRFLIVQFSVLTMFGIIAFWFFYVQHQHEDGYRRWKENWDFLVSSIRGSTYYNLPRLMHWLTGNIGYHHIHHLSSQIPNYNLPKCAKENPILNKYVTKLTFMQSLRTIHNKLWDEKSQRMISFSEYNRMQQNGLLEQRA
jgi:acyl-lipid omega-6 desaturase (Delta-12 desaturase)